MMNLTIARMNNIVNGEQITKDIAGLLETRVLDMETKPRMGVVIVSQNPVTQSYVTKKRLFSQSIGVPFIEKYLPEDIPQDELETEVVDFMQTVDGLVVQLPLPGDLDTPRILDLIPTTKDVDALNPNSSTVGPVAGAVMEILDRHQVDLTDKNVVVVGHGRLVGQPVARALCARDITPVVVDLETVESERDAALLGADVVITGVGVSGMIKPDMVKPGVVLIDAGTSSSRGTVRGDVDPGCADVASLVSLTPGGVGPVTVAKLFENLLDLYTR